MKVSTPSPASRVGTTRRSGGPKGANGQGSSEFSRILNDAMAATDDIHTVDAPAPVGGIEALLAAQAIGDATEEETRRRMVRQGEEILDRLEVLRHGLLDGTLSRENLNELARLARQRRENVQDSELKALLEEIEMRAEIELAKLNQSI